MKSAPSLEACPAEVRSRSAWEKGITVLMSDSTSALSVRVA